MIRLISIFVMGFLNTILAQAPDTLWTKILGGDRHDWGSSIQQTNDGGYIILGLTMETSSHSTGEAWLLKTDADGDTLWTKTYRDSLRDTGSLVHTTDGGYIIIGTTTSYDIWINKTDVNGDTIWTKTFRSDSLIDRGYIVLQTNDGYIILGSANPYNSSDTDIWLIKIDINGAIVWTKTYGGSNSDEAYSIQQTIDGGYIITGYNYLYGGGGGLRLIKTDSYGDTLWTKTYHDLGDGISVKQTVDSGFIILSSYYVRLIKTDANGDTSWTKTYEHGGWGFDSGTEVEQTCDGGYIILANSDITQWDLVPWMSSNIWLIRTDAYGDTLWTKTLGDSLVDISTSFGRTNDGGYIILGNANRTTPFPVYYIGDVWLIKIAPEVTSIEEKLQLSPFEFQINQNYPNPFNPTTSIEFSLPQSDFVTLRVYNILGEVVATLVSEKLNAGKYKYDWDAGDLASGVYLYRMVSGDFVQTSKMILMK